MPFVTSIGPRVLHISHVWGRNRRHAGSGVKVGWSWMLTALGVWLIVVGLIAFGLLVLS